MPRTGGAATKKRILKTAERLFSEKGYDGTGMDELAKLSKINKATIYYHFRDKYQILETLFESIFRDMNRYIEKISSGEKLSMFQKIRAEIDFLEEKRDILSVLLMESLKKSDKEHHILKIAEKFMENEYEDVREKTSTDKKRFFVYEFYTGFIPLVMFIVFKDKWRTYFDTDETRMINNFIEFYILTHVQVLEKV